MTAQRLPGRPVPDPRVPAEPAGAEERPRAGAGLLGDGYHRRQRQAPRVGRQAGTGRWLPPDIGPQPRVGPEKLRSPRVDLQAQPALAADLQRLGHLVVEVVRHLLLRRIHHRVDGHRRHLQLRRILRLDLVADAEGPDVPPGDEHLLPAVPEAESVRRELERARPQHRADLDQEEDQHDGEQAADGEAQRGARVPDRPRDPRDRDGREEQRDGDRRHHIGPAETDPDALLCPRHRHGRRY